LSNRSEYHKQWYQNNKEKIKANYNAQTQWIKWVEVKKTLFKLKKEIGNNSYNRILDELEKLERSKYG
jgi:hypothetical protein